MKIFIHHMVAKYYAVLIAISIRLSAR